MGYRPVGTRRVIFATGETALWSVTELRVQAPKLLGAQTLEIFGLGVDPLGLVPVDAYLA
jgi:hypothetical protein